MPDEVLAALDNPAVFVEVGGVEDVFLLALTYEVRSTKRRSSDGVPLPQITTRIQVRDGDKSLVRESKVHVGRIIGVKGERLWQHTVSSSHILSGLQRGFYGLNVVEEMDRSMGAREYRNMRLMVTKLAA